MIGPFEDKRPLALHHKILHLSGSLEIFSVCLNLARLYNAAASPASRLRSAVSLAIKKEFLDFLRSRKTSIKVVFIKFQVQAITET